MLISIDRIFHSVGADRYDLERLAGLVDKPPLGKWTRYADDAWFRERESHCEAVLSEFLGEAGARSPDVPTPDMRPERSLGGASPDFAPGHPLVEQAP